MTRPDPLLRPSSSDRADHVTYVELFFDLIFVFALTQLSSFLYDNQTPLGALQSALLVLALWWTWVQTTWVTNWLDPARLPVRGVILILALVSFILSVSIFESFGDRGLTFAIAFVALQIIRGVFVLLAVMRHDREIFGSIRRILVWQVIAGVFWIAGGLLPLEYRVPLWVAAILIEYISSSIGFRFPGLGRPRNDDRSLSGPHLAERSALFVILALGESFLVTGFAFVAQPSSPASIAGILIALTSAAAMWWLYFDHGERAGSEAIANAAEPVRMARSAYTYAHAVMIAGIVTTSVADKEILAHPNDAVTTITAVIILGGPLLYLIGLSIFRWVIVRELLVRHLIGSAVLLALFAVAPQLSPLMLAGLATAVLVTVAAWETRVLVVRGKDKPEAG